MKPVKACYRIFALPLFTDNYSYVVEPTPQSPLLLIDPANPHVVLHFLHAYLPKSQVSHVLYTHKHWDHAGGAEDLYHNLPNHHLKVVSGAHDASFIKTVNSPIQTDCQIDVQHCQVSAFGVPCHTRGHVVYHFQPQDSEPQQFPSMEEMKTNEGKPIRVFMSEQCAFTGDTLFSGGIGRFFQGDHQQMHGNLVKIVQNIGDSCDIYNGHEYTLANLKWGHQIEPNNQALSEYLLEAENRECTLPTNLKKEKQVNVFLRAATCNPMQEKIPNGAEYLRILREAKNKGSSVLVDLI